MGGVQTTAGVTLNYLARKIHILWNALKHMSPLIDSNLGEHEPSTSLQVTGYIAYADGTNWNPAGDGTAGFFYWNGSAWTAFGSGGGSGGQSGEIPSGTVLPATGVYKWFMLEVGSKRHLHVWNGSAWKRVMEVS